MASEPAELLLEAFPGWAELHVGCWVRGAIAEDTMDFTAEIQAVTRCRERSALIRRLRTEHPVDRKHLDEHDDRLLDAFTEAEALAWASDVASLGCAEWVSTEGAPDLRAGDDLWIDAKIVRRSDQEQAELRALEGKLQREGMVSRGVRDLLPPGEGLTNKLQYDLDDAVKKWERQSDGRLVVFIEVAGLDFGTSRRRALDLIGSWAQRSARPGEVEVVVCYN